MSAGFKYWAFISYSHQDRAWGNWLHKTLETYRVPKRLVGRASRDTALPHRLFPVFRDRDELPSSADLGGVINEALASSRYQIVICSPRSAASKWVNEEVRHFKSLGREDRVLCLIVDGEPNSGDARECFAPALRFRVTRDGEITAQQAEPIAADAREHADGKQGAKLKLIAGLLGLGFDELVQREKQRQFWKRVQIAAATLAFAGVIAGVSQWFLHQRAAREHEIVLEKVVEAGREELLDGHQARAAVFLNEARKMGDDSVPVRFMLGQAMQTVEALTDIRVRHGGEDAFGSAFNADGSKFLIDAVTTHAGQPHATAKVYEAATGKLIAELPGAPVLPLVVQFFDHDRRVLISGYPDYYKQQAPYTAIWNIDAPAATLHIEGVNGMAGEPLSPDGSTLLVASAAGLQLRSTADGKLLETFAPGRSIAAATFSPDGTAIVVADSSGAIEVLAIRDGREEKKLAAADGQSIAALVYAPDSSRLLALSAQGDMRMWDATGALHIALAADPNAVAHLQFSKDGHRLLTIGTEGYKVWSVARGSLLIFIQEALSPYAAAVLSPDGDTLVTANSESRVSEVWDVLSKHRLSSLDLHASGVSTAAFDAFGKQLLLASHDGSGEIWRTPIAPAWKYASFETYPYTAHFARDGKRLLIAGGDELHDTAMILDPSSGQILQTFHGHRGLVRDAAFDSTEDRVLTAGQDGRAIVWDTKQGREQAQLGENANGLESALFSPDAQRVVTLTHIELQDTHDAAGLWDAKTGKRVAALDHDGLVWSARFSPDSALVATAGEDARIKLWRATDGGLVRTLSGHTARVMSAVFSGDGKRVLSASHDNSVRVWSVEDGRQLAAFSDVALGLPVSAKFSPDERTVAIATQAGNVWLWQPASGIATVLKGHRQQVNGIAYSSDGQLLFSYGLDGTVRAWDTGARVELQVVAAHESSVNAIDIDATGTRLLSTNWGKSEMSNVGTESRPADALAKVLACKQPWTLDPATLSLALKNVEASACR